MAFFNGSGGAGDATTDSTSQAIAAVEAAAQAAASATQAATSATNAGTSATAAATSATNALASANAASTSASNAATSANSSAASATEATNQATLAAGSATAAASSATSADGFADLAQEWAIKTSSAVAGGEYSAKYHANAAATSATNAANSASAASTSASNAATSATNASGFADDAEASALAAAASFDSFDDKYLGAKSSAPSVDNDGNAIATGALYWNTTENKMYVYDGSWTVITSGGAGSGTVTSVAMSVPTGLSVSGSPITSSGTLAVTYASGYAIPTTAKQTEWDTAYGWGNHASAGYLTSSAIGTTVQAYDADLTSWAAITPSSKQDTLVSGTNIKTVNSTSLLGSGNISVGTVTSVAATAGTGISISGSPITGSGTLTITNTAPDQTVALTAGTGISTSGTYPNFTITNSAPDQTVSLTAGTGISVTGTYPSFTIANTASASGDVVGPSSSTDNAIARFDGTTGKLIQNSAVTIDDTTGSMTFTGSSARILGDFSNATVANRLLFQTSTSNGATRLGVIPNGTASTSGLRVFNTSNTASAGASVELNVTSAGGIISVNPYNGGTAIPLQFNVNGANRGIIDTSGRWGIGTDIPTSGYLLDVAGGIKLSGAFDETVFAVTGTTPALSPSNGTIQTWTLSGNSTPTAGTWNDGESLTLMVLDGTAFTITWTSVAVTWVGGTAPTLDTTKQTVIELWRVGGVIYGALVGAA